MIETARVPDGTTSERLVLFTDAVAAIAITLLILPLLETIPEATAKESLGGFVHGHLEEFGAFALSFAVIFRVWWGHHRLFRHVETITPRLVSLSMLWTFAIVLLPIPTALITAYPPSAGSVGLYGGTLSLAMAAMSLMAIYVRRHPELSAGRPPVSRERVLFNLTNLGVQVVATIIGAVFAETVNFWAFLLMFLVGPIDAAITARWRRS
jgi:uncharacterized membrane protein